MFDAILFDVDGLMVDTERLYVQTMRDIARNFGHEVQDATLAKMMGRGPMESIVLFLADLGVSANPAEVLAVREEIMLKKLRTEPLPMPGLFELLDHASTRYRLGIATGSPRKFLVEILARLAAGAKFSASLAGDEVSRGKPHPEIYMRVAGMLDVPTECCIVLEDSSNGVRAGKAAGCYVIAVPNEHTRRQDFSMADRVMADLREARKWIQELSMD